MRGAVKHLVLAAAVLLLPSVAFAQATITGTVRDSSNAVMPGVTVEAASPALLTPRTAVTEDNGVYRILDLPPGAYTLTYTLAGFSRVVRSVDVSGSGTITIPVELTVGGLTETVTVSSETPVVDVQTIKRETVLRSEFIESLPATRHYSAILQMIPAINVGFAISAETTPEMQLFNARGGEGNVLD